VCHIKNTLLFAKYTFSKVDARFDSKAVIIRATIKNSYPYVTQNILYVQLGARNFAHQFLCHLKKKRSSLSFIVIIINHDICDHD
jgi:hypothetical protein